jgi:phosphatidate cytidylyltransferase
MAVIGIPILILSEYIVFAILMSLLSVVALFEMFRAIGIEKHLVVCAPTYFMGLAFPVLCYYFAEAHTFGIILIGAAALFIYLMYTFFVAVFNKGKIKFFEIAEAFVIASYVIFSFGAISIMRYMDSAKGLLYVILMLVCAWGSDVFAYFTGRLFGKHKLIPEVSPKKTVEGAIGGIVCAGGLSMLYGFIVSSVTGLTPNYIILAICGVVLSAFSQVGDLIASLLKREHGIKDYGNIFPGHGGVMDRFDSILAIATVLMAITVVFPPFV